MATRKKKSEVIMSADVAEMTNKPSGGWPIIKQGSHLTVKTFEDGRTELIWDDEALLRDVQNALTEHEKSVKVTTTATKVKKTKK
jgi:hypothetical protein